MQKHVNLVDLVKSFPTNIFLQNLASIQKRTSPLKSAHLAEKSENGSISNLSTKVHALASTPELKPSIVGLEGESPFCFGKSPFSAFRSDRLSPELEASFLVAI